MRRKFIIHIGLPKTGSTALQEFLGAHRPEIAARGCCFPRSPGHSHQRLLSAFASSKAQVPEGALWRGLEPQARLDLFRAEFEQELQGLPDSIDRVILSDENLTLATRKVEEIQELHRLVEPFADSFRIVIYLRRQDQFLASLYSQSLRNGGIRTPEDFTASGAKLKLYNYWALHRMWMKVFGRDAMVPRIYEAVGKSRFDTVEDFKSLSDVALADIEDTAPRVVNPSISAAGQRALLRIGAQQQARSATERPKGRYWNEVTTIVTETSAGKGWQPSTEAAEAFMAAHEVGNEKLRARYFPERTSLFAPLSGQAAKERATTDINEEYDAVCRALLAAVDKMQAIKLELAGEVARTAERNGDLTQLRAGLNEGLRTDQTSASFRVRLVELNILEGKLHAARSTLKALLKLEPDHPEAASLQARITEAERAGAATRVPG